MPVSPSDYAVSLTLIYYRTKVSWISYLMFLQIRVIYFGLL